MKQQPGGIADVARVKMAVGGRGFDAQAYLAANPDVYHAQQAAASGQASARDVAYWQKHYGDDALSSPERFAAVHYNYAQRHTPHQAQRYYDELDRRAAAQAASRPSAGAMPAAAPAGSPPSALPGARPLFPGSSAGVPQTPGYVPPAFDVSASPYVSAGQGFGSTLPQVGGAYDDAVRRAQQYFSSMQPGGELIDPADAVMVPPMPTQWQPQTAVALPPLLPEQERQPFAAGGSADMDLPHNNHQLPQTPVGPRITGPVLGPGTDTSDNIPAALSPNEFVFTARAVRNAGGGDVDRGIQAMYDLMHRLERSA